MTEATVPGSDQSGEGLVEPEGVNAGSATPPAAGEGDADVTSGGAPERAGEGSTLSGGSLETESPDAIGAPGQQPGTPGQQVSSGEN